MNKVSNISPLRYPGSKQKIVPYLEKILSHNCLDPELLVEPFVGGGSVFLSFLTRGFVHKALIADRDPLIYAFWKTLFEEPTVLTDFVSKVKINVNKFAYFKNIAINPINVPRSKLACTCLFLNRTSFSGITSLSSGPIGGLAQSSPYRIDCRFNRTKLISKIEYISAFKNQVVVLKFDWTKTINHTLRHYEKHYNSKAIFYYLDPPFYTKAKALYRTFFKEKQHIALSKFLLNFNANWILSYDNAKEIRSLYSTHTRNRVHFQVPYSINSHAKRLVKELVITPLNIPINT